MQQYIWCKWSRVHLAIGIVSQFSNFIDILRFLLIVISWWFCIVVYGDCFCGNSCIGGGGLQYGGQISSLIIIPLLLSSNVGGSGNDVLCSASSCANKFSNAVGIPIIVAKARNGINTLN